MISGLTLSSLSFWSGLFHLWIWSEPLFQIGVSIKNQNRMANSVDPDETAHYEPSHQDLRCLQKQMVWSAVLKGLTMSQPMRATCVICYMKGNMVMTCTIDEFTLELWAVMRKLKWEEFIFIIGHYESISSSDFAFNGLSIKYCIRKQNYGSTTWKKRPLWKLDRCLIFCHSYKGVNVCVFLLTFHHTNPFEKGSTLKGKNLLP